MLVEEGVGMVVIESTGTYWKPFYYLLEDHLALTLVNAREAKTVPGRKTDVADAEWLADLGAHGLVRASLVPPPPIRELRDLTRTRATIARDRAREVQRLEKLLEDAQIKLSSVVTDLCGVASRRILTALMSGVTDPDALVLFRGGLKVSAADLTEALTGRFTEHHAFMTRLLLNRIDQHNAAIQHLEQRIEQKINSVQAPRELLTSIAGVSRTVADIIIAETGADMTAFATAAHRCSWAGSVPGNMSPPADAKQPHPSGELPPQSRPWHRRHVDNQAAQHLPVRQVPTHRRPPRKTQSRRRGRTGNPHRGLAHAQRRHLLPRPRTGLLQQAPPQQTRGPCRTRPPSPRLPGHRSPRRRGQLSRPAHQFRINEEVSGLRPALKDESTASTTCVA
jgi:transposase